MANSIQRIRQEFSRRITDLAVAAFGLVAALAWNDAIKELISKYIAPGSTLVSRVIYALIVTTLAVVVTILLSRLISKDNGKERK
jgi:hypothetical protein